MNKTVLSIAPAAVLALALASCTDPVGDKPRATVEPSPSGSATPTASTPPPSAAPPVAGATRYAISSESSKVGFVGAKVTGKHNGGFRKFSGTLDAAGDDVTKGRVDIEIDMTSVFTDNEKLTKHLMSPEFFDVEKIPTARFTSTEIKKNADGTATITGDLTLHGVTKRISFPATVTSSKDAVTAKAEFGLNRKDFGIVYPGKPDDLIKDEVLMQLDITAKPATATGG